MDKIDREILEILLADARTSHARIGKTVGLATSSVTERIKKLARSGVIKGWTIRVDQDAIGLPVLAFLFVFVSRDARRGQFEADVQDLPEVLEYHHVTGEWTYLLKVRAASIHALEEFMLNQLQAITSVEKTHTLIALSSSEDVR